MKKILFRHVIKKIHYGNMILFSENSEYLFMQFDSNYMLLNLKTYRSIEIKDADIVILLEIDMKM